MLKVTQATASRVIPLRTARSAFTRSRIAEAARELFFVRGYAATTLEQIAAAAGTRRSTLYTHFRDKEEILALIADEHVGSLVAIVERLAGPTPSRAEIDRWVRELAEFYAAERTPAILVIHLAHAPEVPAPILHIRVRLLEALAVQLPAFREALEPGPRQGRAFAWATVVLRELSWACLYYALEAGQAPWSDRLTVATELFERFVREQN
jgi:AcrR family transcriptional regulator